MVSCRLQQSGAKFVTVQNILFNATFIPNAIYLALTGRLVCLGNCNPGRRFALPWAVTPCPFRAEETVITLRFIPAIVIFAHKILPHPVLAQSPG